MGGRRRVGAALLAAAFLISCASDRLLAAEDDADARVLLFSGRDVWRHGAFAHGGLIWGPYGFNRNTPLLRLLLSGGVYRYDSGSLGGARVIGAEGVAQVMPGWQIKRGPFEAKFFFGPEYQFHRLWPDDPANRLRGPAFGLRFAVDLWAEPTPATMLAADTSLSSIATSHSARVALGWRVFDRFYAGPETQVYGGDGYRQWRLGAHITSMKAGDTEWSAAGGWAVDSEGRSSLYLRLGILQRR
jgi:hypothetical protein